MNLFEIQPNALREVTDILYQSAAVRIERIVSCGQASPDGFWYDQDEDEWLTVLDGSAVLEFADESVCLKKGDTLLIPAHRRHRVQQTSAAPACIWLCVFAKAER